MNHSDNDSTVMFRRPCQGQGLATGAAMPPLLALADGIREDRVVARLCCTALPVSEINTHLTCVQCRTPSIPLIPMFTDTRKVSAIGL